MSRRERVRIAAKASHVRRHRALLQLWLSPSFPVGGFAYSHGLEKAVENGWIDDCATLKAWLADLVEVGSLRNDLILAAAAWRATTAKDSEALIAVADLAAALQPSRERALEAGQQGASFMSQIDAAWPADACCWSSFASDREPTYPIAVAFAASSHSIALADMLDAYAVAFIGTLGSAAIRLGVIGQSDAQRVVAALMDRILAASAFAQVSTLDDLGAATWRSDLASLQHETQHTRLFRS